MTDIPRIIEAGIIPVTALGNSANPVTDITSDLQATTKIWDTLSSRSFLQRVAEAIIGGMLLIVAVNHMTNGGISKTLGKVIV